MKFELSQTFIFEAAHTLDRAFERETSLRIHGHTYHAEVAIEGEPDPETGLVQDLAEFRGTLDQVKGLLDHRLLDDVEGIGPPTLENLCAFIWRSLADQLPYLSLVKVSRRATGDSCLVRR